MGHVEFSAKEGNQRSFTGAAEFLTNSLNKRLEHYLNPQIAQVVFGGGKVAKVEAPPIQNEEVEKLKEDLQNV